MGLENFNGNTVFSFRFGAGRTRLCEISNRTIVLSVLWIQRQGTGAHLRRLEQFPGTGLFLSIDPEANTEARNKYPSL
tara:strand:+ start:103 stop:336 length:234 start_codon:yes stop_codon:yes gene_type:complete